ncbi:MAG TPA: TolC family protein [Candidatus Omnitrophota bacterium]|nr:TolC family protein [Candidatus Omnitrophota bacterium]
MRIVPDKNISRSLITIVLSVVCVFTGNVPNAISAENPGKISCGENRLITMSDGINRVLKDGRLIKIEMSDEDMSFADTIVALSPLLPHVRANMSQTYNRYVPEMLFGSQAVAMGEKEPFAGGVSIYQTLFDFGKSISNYRAATEILHAKKATVESVKRAVTLEFIMAYLDVLESEKMITVAEKETESITAYLKDMTSMYEQGVIVENDLLAAKVKLSDAEQRLIAVRNHRAVAAAKINTLLTLSLVDEIAVRDIKSEIPAISDIKDAWQNAEKLRPEIKFYNSQIKSSNLRENAKAVQNLPTIFTEGGYSYGENRYMVHQHTTYWMFGAKMDLYDGGLSVGDVSKERAFQRQLCEQKNKLIDDMRFEIKASYVGLQDAIKKVAVTKDALAQSEENVRFYRVKYNNGAATSTDVLEAIALQTKAQANYYTADYEAKRYYAKLMYSTGADMVSFYNETEK